MFCKREMFEFTYSTEWEFGISSMFTQFFRFYFLNRTEISVSQWTKTKPFEKDNNDQARHSEPPTDEYLLRIYLGCD